MDNPCTRTCLQDEMLTNSSEDSVGFAYLGEEECAIFNELVSHRRSLPVCRVGYWVCHECHFESRWLTVMAGHIMREHEAAPATAEERDE